MVSEKQKELDKMKWEDSEVFGEDTCGSYGFCKFCDKELENPCEKAFMRLERECVKKNTAKKSKNKAKINGKEFRATVVDKN